jgi:hypothetical protein
MPRKRSLPNSEIAPEVTASSAGTGAAQARKMDTPIANKKTRNRPTKTVKHSTKAVETKDTLPPGVAVTTAPEPVQTFSSEQFQQEIASLAYRFWEDRGRTVGDPLEDWLKAEREVQARLAASRN